ncbi:MAG: enoyl-CoA hydratase-related protein, partial [Ignavibacteria bacterium]
MYVRDQFATWDKIRKIKKPIIAATSGFVLGGGCELALTCDIIVAAECTKFGQPEIKLGIIPGAGGTQRLTRAIGKARAMEMILTGKMYSAKEMFDAGMVSRLADDEVYLEDAQALAKEIASMPVLALQMAKETILKSFDTTIEQGLEFERKSFYLLFASEDMREGMNAFIEKRPPEWKGK